jgi:hypothetical protein
LGGAGSQPVDGVSCARGSEQSYDQDGYDALIHVLSLLRTAVALAAVAQKPSLSAIFGPTYKSFDSYAVLGKFVAP